VLLWRSRLLLLITFWWSTLLFVTTFHCCYGTLLCLFDIYYIVLLLDIPRLHCCYIILLRLLCTLIVFPRCCCCCYCYLLLIWILTLLLLLIVVVDLLVFLLLTPYVFNCCYGCCWLLLMLHLPVVRLLLTRHVVRCCWLLLCFVVIYVYCIFTLTLVVDYCLCCYWLFRCCTMDCCTVLHCYIYGQDTWFGIFLDCCTDPLLLLCYILFVCDSVDCCWLLLFPDWLFITLPFGCCLPVITFCFIVHCVTVSLLPRYIIYILFCYVVTLLLIGCSLLLLVDGFTFYRCSYAHCVVTVLYCCCVYTQFTYGCTLFGCLYIFFDLLIGCWLDALFIIVIYYSWTLFVDCCYCLLTCVVCRYVVQLRTICWTLIVWCY